MVMKNFLRVGDARRDNGFTIVELLIVVVVIAILASITIVSFNGIKQRAEISAAQSDLTTTSKKLEIDRITSGGVYTESAINESLYKVSASGMVTQYRYGDLTSFCLDATKQSTVYNIVSNDGTTSTSPGACPATTSTASSLCVAGNVNVAASQQNYSSETVNMTATSPYGTSTTTAVLPGVTRSISFNARMASIPRGIVTFQLVGATFSATRYQAYPDRNC